MDDKIWILFTVDLENMNTPLLEGRYDHNLFSMDVVEPLLKILDRYKIKAVFFASVFECYRFGENEIARLLRYIHSCGHDIELHTHPYWRYGKEHMWQYVLSEQIQIMRHGRDLLTDWIGRPPIAHRAGAYSISQESLNAMHVNKIHIDSSMFYGHHNCKINWSKNQLVEKNGVVEIPVTGFCRQRYIGLNRMKIRYRKDFIKTDLDWCSLDELTHFIQQAKSNDLKIMNFFMHSYSLLEHDGHFRHFKLDLKKGQTLCRFLKFCTQDIDTQFITIQQFWNEYQNNPHQFMGDDFVPVGSVNIDIIQFFLTRLNDFVGRKRKNP